MQTSSFQIIFFFTVHNHIVWKLLKMSHLNFGIFHQFCPFKSDLSGNAIWPQASHFQKLAKMDFFGIFHLLLSIQNVFSMIFKHCASSQVHIFWKLQFYFQWCFPTRFGDFRRAESPLWSWNQSHNFEACPNVSQKVSNFENGNRSLSQTRSPQRWRILESLEKGNFWAGKVSQCLYETFRIGGFGRTMELWNVSAIYWTLHYRNGI